MNKIPVSDDVLEAVGGGTQIPYIVGAKDTVETIAKKFSCTPEQICRWNNLRGPQDIRPGMKLMIYF